MRGRLYDLPLGFPALVVPNEDVNALGTVEYLADADLAHSIRVGAREPLPGWDTVRGELLTFDDPEERLREIDGLEGFRPGEEGLYTRVLIPVMLAEGGRSIPAWAYAIEEGIGVRLPGGSWPA